MLVMVIEMYILSFFRYSLNARGVETKNGVKKAPSRAHAPMQFTQTLSAI